MKHTLNRIFQPALWIQLEEFFSSFSGFEGEYLLKDLYLTRSFLAPGPAISDFMVEVRPSSPFIAFSHGDR